VAQAEAILDRIAVVEKAFLDRRNRRRFFRSAYALSGYGVTSPPIYYAT
jgi:hypothetical protein